MTLRGIVGVGAGVILAAGIAGYFYFPNPLWTTGRMIRSLESENEMHRLMAVGLLKDRAPGSEKAIAALVLALGDKWDEVRGSASTTLCEIGEPAIPYLRPALQDNNQLARETASQTMICMQRFEKK
ncbi:MAG: hypothetical protein A2270_06965 [Elusimicrobia bacterium RIFOXYA12_FULL_51_18]|nr:MAG: hypothetical protein A2270_06965 [Elusimicrobia bacterium RIFOXYA12_FULL_51_18]OGS28427.1 MAG: hypothetical protein A2218_05270 [Elusimicrobia bacterium RIFOXYA2_FULL_53_38]